MLELVGRYRIEERIGEGAMADVYRAYDPSINRPLAVKVLKAEYRQNPEYAGRFLREAKAAGALSHPNIVTIYDVGEVDGYPFIVMELLDGLPLSDVMQREGAQSPERVMALGLQLAEALAYAHAQGVVHRDIKPSNIVVSADGRSVKLLDFGIARLADSDVFQTESLKTQVGQVLGTPRYMSPEQALGGTVDGRSDLFSVGVVLYEMISGVRAFAGASAATLAIQITQLDPEPLAKVAPKAPRGLQFIVSKLLAKRADRRFADGAQLAEAIRKELHVYAVVSDEAQAKHTYLPLQVRLTLLLGAITALVLAGAIGTVLWRQYQAMEQVAVASGSAISSFVAQNAGLRVVENAALPAEQRDWAPVEAFVRFASEDPNVREITVVDADGVVRAATDPASVGKPYHARQGEPLVRRRADLVVSSATDRAGRSSFRFVRPILYAGRSFGRVDVSLSKAALEEAARLTQLLMLALGLVTLGVVAITTYVSARLLERPIIRLKAAFRDAAKGNLDFRISHNRRDEFGELFDGFNVFTAAMQERLDSVESMALDTPNAPSSTAATPAEPEPLRPTGPFARPELVPTAPQAASGDASSPRTDPLPAPPTQAPAMHPLDAVEPSTRPAFHESDYAKVAPSSDGSHSWRGAEPVLSDPGFAEPEYPDPEPPPFAPPVLPDPEPTPAPPAPSPTSATPAPAAVSPATARTGPFDWSEPWPDAPAKHDPLAAFDPPPPPQPPASVEPKPPATPPAPSRSSSDQDEDRTLIGPSPHARR